MAKEITDANFQELLAEGKPLVVDFWAPWCGPCKMISPIFDELAAEYEGRIIAGKVNVDDNDETCAAYGIMNIPTILFFKNGELVYTCPSLDEVRSYCLEQVDTLWDEVKRFDNPHTYYVDLSQKLWDIKYGLLKKNNGKNNG